MRDRAGQIPSHRRPGAWWSLRSLQRLGSENGCPGQSGTGRTCPARSGEGEEVGAQPQPHKPHREVHRQSKAGEVQFWLLELLQLCPHKHIKFTRKICKIYAYKHRQKTGEVCAKM